MHELTKYYLFGSSFYFAIYAVTAIPFNELGMFLLKLFGKV